MTVPLNPPNDSIAPRLLIPVGIIIGISLPIYVARMYSRIQIHHKLSWDDYAITLAEICSIVGYALVAVSCKYGIGRHTIHVSSRDRSNALFYFFVQGIVWYWGMAAMKISVASLLLRMQCSTTWKRILWIMVAVQIFVAMFATIFGFTFCVPIRSLWESVPTAKCRSTHASQAWGYAYTAISITSDLFLSLMPLTFIWRLRRPKLERVVIAILMCLGLAATTTAIIKLTDMSRHGFSGDVLRNLLIMTKWCMLEEVIGVTAASIPYLKAPTERTLERLGLRLVADKHEPWPNEVRCPPIRICAVEEALKSGNVESEVGSSRSGEAEFELGQSSKW